MTDTNELTLEQVENMYGQLPSFKEAFYDWWGGNVGLFKLINSFHTPGYDAFMRFVTQLGDRHFFLEFMGLLSVYVLLSLFIAKIQRRGAMRQRCIMWFGVFSVLFAGFVVNAGVIYIMKDYMQFPRPYVALPAFEVTVADTIKGGESYRSFPSGHASFITLMIVGLWPMLSAHMKLLGLFLIVLVSWSRVSLGLHFPADTVGAFFITSALVISVRFLVYRFYRALFGINCGAT